MRNIIPRVVAIHDISGFGRCSMTVIIPVLSSMGIQVCPLPTAVLSTHTGGYGDFSFHDLTESMEEYASHWKHEGISFDCIYSGFLGSERQIDIVDGFFKDFKKDGNRLIVVDPVMADNGKLYRTYTEEMKGKMGQLVRLADIITPNLTEACFLLDEPYPDSPIDLDKMKSLLKALTQMGPRAAVITGLKDEGNCYSNMAYSSTENVFWRVGYNHIPVHYPGTGDIFTSVLTGGLLNGDSLPIAMDRATQFLSLAVSKTYEYKTPEREGVVLEKVIGWLGGELTNCSYEAIE